MVEMCSRVVREVREKVAEQWWRVVKVCGRTKAETAVRCLMVVIPHAVIVERARDKSA